MKERIWKITYQLPGGELESRLFKGKLSEFLRFIPRETLILGDPKDVTKETVTANEIITRVIARTQGDENES